MKKLLALALIATFTVASCTNQSVADENSENKIQLLGKDEYVDKGSRGQEDN